MNAERGVVYVATGAGHVEAARRSAASVRSANPGLPITLWSDSEGTLDEFDRMERVPDPHERSKVDWIWRTPYEHTLYLDSDTRVLGDLGPGFAVLERFDLAAAQVPRWYIATYQRNWRHRVPTAFPQLDAGVVFFRRTDRVVAFLKGWQAAYHEADFELDQVTFRDLLWSSDLRIAVLPDIYNFRRMPVLRGLFSAKPEPVVLHMRRFHPSKRKWWQRDLPPGSG